MIRKKILVISDNINLCVEFKKIINKKEFIDVDYSISPYSNESFFNIELNEKVIVFDLKDDGCIRTIINNKYNLIFSIHCKQLFPKLLVDEVKCINIHPGYNPINRGWYPQVFSIIKNLPIGATIHEIDNQLDHGLIIDRDFVKKEMFDTSETLYNKIIKKEVDLLKNNIDSLLSGEYVGEEPERGGNLFFKSDFNKLCRLDLNEKMTMGDAINRLRALTHGNHNNAYFIDYVTKNKIYVSIDLRESND